MKITVRDRLPFVTVIIQQEGRTLSLSNVLLDTGSAGSVFPADKLQEAGISPKPTANIRRITGIGDDEFLIETEVEQIITGELMIANFTIEAGAMDYGFDIEGILGFDFLEQAGAIINLGTMEIQPNKNYGQGAR